jgi:hypothetical protein
MLLPNPRAEEGFSAVRRAARARVTRGARVALDRA